MCLYCWLDFCVPLPHLSGDILYVLNEVREYKSLFSTLATSDCDWIKKLISYGICFVSVFINNGIIIQLSPRSYHEKHTWLNRHTVLISFKLATKSFYWKKEISRTIVLYQVYHDISPHQRFSCLWVLKRLKTLS